jgi:hypothetical protein
MTVSLEIYEVTGPAPGTPVIVNNINFKRSSNISDDYNLYPIKRPISINEDFNYSYQKWIYFKFKNTDSYIKNPTINISVNTEGSKDTFLYYRFSNTYIEPNGTGDHSMTYIKDKNIKLFPLVSSSSPAAATGHIVTLQPNVDYYTNYLVLQSRVKYHYPIEEVGNADSIKLTFSFDSF